ncbi:hypothetical protein [Salinactinospora qingdaonensis]|uniref:ABM domain-containing protein n=1 Tax=Salinactinospora qingdaonensis TaxID=702744 RepID=A0ABP7FTA7_9ACTN
MPTERSAPILFHNTMRVAEGHWESFRRAAEHAVAFTEEQAPQLMVEIFADEDRMLAHSFQLYEDSDAIRAHWRMSGSYISDIMEHCSVERLDVYGEPDQVIVDTLRSSSGDVPITIHPRLAGFTRFAG